MPSIISAVWTKPMIYDKVRRFANVAVARKVNIGLFPSGNSTVCLYLARVPCDRPVFLLLCTKKIHCMSIVPDRYIFMIHRRHSIGYSKS